MTSLKVTMQTLIFTVLLPLMFSSAFADNSATDADLRPASNNGASAQVDSATTFHLKGILVSNSGRSILVNDTVAREGDRVAGIDILSISEGRVRVWNGTREQILRVGFSGQWEHSVNSPLVTPTELDSHYGPVVRGETLSDIAERQLSGDVTMDQMMIALFQANPQAFAGNINVLREGATLRIPDVVALHQQAPETATVEVARQMNVWQTDHAQPIQLAEELGPTKSLDTTSYGPVARGETLSGIAARISNNGVTMHDLMMALFRANPQAFNGDIDVLHEGAVLRVPYQDELQFQEREIATAKVMPRVVPWSDDSLKRLQSARASNFMNMPHDVSPEYGGVLFSMKSFE